VLFVTAIKLKEQYMGGSEGSDRKNLELLVRKCALAMARGAANSFRDLIVQRPSLA